MDIEAVGQSRHESLAHWLQDRLAELAACHDVPGAAVAILHQGQMTEAATGVLNRNTRVRTTTDSVFQIGSVTKVVTATLVMQLVEEGLLDLDVPVITHLPGFRTADAEMSRSITPRHLLTHTAGFEGDVFVDTGRGDDALERFMPALAAAAQFSAPGVLFSYSNAGYNVLGRLIELLRRSTFEQVVHERIARPLGLKRVACSADEAILLRAAAGHLRPAPGKKPKTVDAWSLMRSGAPAGTTVCMSAADLARFSQVHMASPEEGSEAVLSRESVALMQQCHVDTSALLQPMRGRGLGWALVHSDSSPVIGHSGATVGQYSFLRVVPDQDLAVALLTNGGDADAMAQTLLAEVLQDLAGVTVSAGARVTETADPVPTPERFTGTFESNLFSLDVSVDSDGRWWAERIPGNIALFVGDQGERYELKPVGDGDFVRMVSGGQGVEPHIFLGHDDERPAQFLHTGRALRRRPR